MMIFTCLNARLAWSYDKASRDIGSDNRDWRIVLPSRRFSLHGLGLTGVSCLVKGWRSINAFDFFFPLGLCDLFGGNVPRTARRRLARSALFSA